MPRGVNQPEGQELALSPKQNSSDSANAVRLGDLCVYDFLSDDELPEEITHKHLFQHGIIT